MATIKVPYLQWRAGRPRWEPGPGLRAKGHHGRDLKDEAGRWLGLEAAIAAATEINRGVDEWRARGAPRRRLPVQRKSPHSCEALWDKWSASADFAKLAPVSQGDYRLKVRLWLDAGFAPAPVTSVTKPQLLGWWQQTYDARGHSMANGILAVVRSMFSYAELVGWRSEGTNPAFKMKRPTLPPRLVVWTPAEVSHLVATADGLGLPSIGDAIVVALHTGQRQGDVLALEWPRLEGGRAVFRQSKRGARVSIPVTPQLEARLAAIRARRPAGAVTELDTARHLIIAESTGRPFKRHHFHNAFARVRAAAAETLPAIAGKQFLDLRDTAITRLALAGCTVPEIRAITGHSLQTVHQVLAHYLALDDAQADAAIARLKVWMQEEGIAL